MRVEVKRRSLGARGDPEFGARLACVSIPFVDDGDMARRLCARVAAYRISAFRHSVGGSAGRASRVMARVGVLEKAAHGKWEF